MAFDRDDDLSYPRGGRLLPPSPVVGKMNLVNIPSIPREGKEFSVIIVAFVSFYKKLHVCFLDTTVYFFCTYIAHDLVGMKQV